MGQREAIFHILFPVKEETPSSSLRPYTHTHSCIHPYKYTHRASRGVLPRHRSCQISASRALFVCVFRYDVSTPSEELHQLRKPSVALAFVRSEAQADGAGLLPNQSGDSPSFGLCEIAGASRRRHVSDHLEQIKSYQDTNSPGRKRPQLEISLTLQKTPTRITVHLHAHTHTAVRK